MASFSSSCVGAKEFSVLPFQVVWHDVVGSTMDATKEHILANEVTEDCFAVMAGRQTSGRGTKGRAWASEPNNLFVTFAVKTQAIRTPLHLTPLRVGVLLRGVVGKFTAQPDAIQLKWPNDVLIRGEKLSGILIEMERDYLLVGVGVNVATTPDVLPTGQDCGRRATSLAHHLADPDQWRLASSAHVTQGEGEGSGGGEGGKALDGARLARAVGMELCLALHNWAATSGADSATAIVSDFTAAMDCTGQRLRPEADVHTSGMEGEGRGGGGRGAGESITPLRVNADGTLLVRDAAGSTRTLVADYLF